MDHGQVEFLLAIRMAFVDKAIVTVPLTKITTVILVLMSLGNFHVRLEKRG